jgi:FAD/FMN-containing dehydrogenase
VKNGLVVDVGEMDAVTVSPDRVTAEVGAGVRMSALSEALGEAGVTVPLATGKSVGIAGLVLGGGFGVTTRKWGLTCDSLVEVNLVLADGSVVCANETANADLFWACCGGGGGNFGIATSFTFKVHAVENVALFAVTYPWSELDAVVDRFQRWTITVDDGVTAFLTLLATGQIELQGQFTASDLELVNAAGHLAPMLDPTLKPLNKEIRVLP